jgi:hypothetical protein
MVGSVCNKNIDLRIQYGQNQKIETHEKDFFIPINSWFYYNYGCFMRLC